MTTHVKSEVLGVLDPHQVSTVMKSSPTFVGGYPVPGPQSPTVTSAMNKDCFVDDNTWRLIAENGDFDDIVVGSGFCALGYIDEALRLNPFRKILLLERGGFWLPDHFQNLPLPFQFVQQDVSETFPWELTSQTAENKIYLNGSSPFFGGRSSFWSIWSPRAIYDRPANVKYPGEVIIPGDALNEGDIEDLGEDDTHDLMDGFPQFMKEIARKPDFYKGVDRLLRVQRADRIKDPVFHSVLQKRFDYYLAEDLLKEVNDRIITGAESAKPARLATGVPVGRPTTGFRQFSAVGSLLSINEWQNKLAKRDPPAGSPLMIATDVVVERFETEPENGDHPSHARVLHTSRGPLTLRSGSTNVILATGAIPATTILLNSLNDTTNHCPGKRLTSHFRSQIKARFKPSQAWHTENEQVTPLPDVPVISACHVRGRFNNLQWHIQVNGSYEPVGYQDRTLSKEEKAQLSSRLFTSLAPDNGDTLTPEQMETSEGYVIISCSVLGEQPKDENIKVERNGPNVTNTPDVTTNVRLHLHLPENAKTLYDFMEESTFKAIGVIAAHRLGELEYWNRENREWEKVDTPVPVSPKRYISRVKSLFHEASTSFMTEDFTKVDENNETADDVSLASVDKNYRPYGLSEGNVYVTGAGLFPTAGSWNPTPTIVGFAQDLAKSLVISPKRVPVLTQKQPVSTTKTLRHPYIIGFKTQANGAVSLWSFRGKELLPSHPLGDFSYTNDRHVCLLADTTGRPGGLHDLVLFGNTGVHVATRNSKENKFDNFNAKVFSLADFAFNSGWRVDKHIRYMADVRKTGRADIIGFGDAGVVLSENIKDGDTFSFTTPSVVLNDLGYDQGWRLNKHLRFLANFYGNGVPDIIGFGETDVCLVKNNGNGTFENRHDLGLNQFTYSHGWRVDKHVRTLADVAGKKGLADIVGFGDEGVYVAINNGDGTVKPAALALKEFGYNQNWRAEKHVRIIADLNGDGLGDIVGFGENGVYVSKNRGNMSFEKPRLVLRDFGYEQNWRVEKHSRFMIDVTGNGCADIVGFGDRAVYVAFGDGEGGFGHTQRLTEAFCSQKGWDLSKTVRYIARLD